MVNHQQEYTAIHTYRIIIVGSGKLSLNFIRSFSKNKQFEIEVHARNEKVCQNIAEEYGIPSFAGFENIPSKADFYLIAVSDNAIPDIAEKLTKVEGIVLHTSGSVDMHALSASEKFGVFYPLQSFTQVSQFDWIDIPILIEACCDETMNKLITFAGIISNKVVGVNSENRRLYHLAAIFSNNFVNHILALSHNILRNAGLHPDVLNPLITETFQRVANKNPALFQTGPAIRNDKETLEKHLALLSENPELVEVYKALTNSIQNFSNFSRI